VDKNSKKKEVKSLLLQTRGKEGTRGREVSGTASLREETISAQKFAMEKHIGPRRLIAYESLEK